MANNDNRVRCPVCNSARVQKIGYVPTVSLGLRPRYRCYPSGHTFYSKKDVFEKQ